jgi:hypothetical protein
LILSNRGFTAVQGTQKTLEFRELLLSLFQGNGHGDGRADHGVVTCAERAFHARGISKKKPSPNQ